MLTIGSPRACNTSAVIRSDPGALLFLSEDMAFLTSSFCYNEFLRRWFYTRCRSNRLDIVVLAWTFSSPHCFGDNISFVITNQKLCSFKGWSFS